MKKKQDGPQHLGKTSQSEDQAPEGEKVDFKGFRPPAVADQAPAGEKNKAAAVHSAQAAAAKTEDRLKGTEGEIPEEPLPDPIDGSTFDQMAEGVLNQFQLREQLQTEHQRKIIEEKLEKKGMKVKLSQMYEIGEFRQTVPIVDGEFEPEFRSITPEEDVQIKLMMSKEDETVSLRYLNDKYAVISMVCGLRKINDTTLPEHFTNQAGWNQKTFEEKAKIVMRMPVPAVWSLMVHNIWFEDRCRKVFRLEDLKNG